MTQQDKTSLILEELNSYKKDVTPVLENILKCIQQVKEVIKSEEKLDLTMLSDFDGRFSDDKNIFMHISSSNFPC